MWGPHIRRMRFSQYARAYYNLVLVFSAPTYTWPKKKGERMLWKPRSCANYANSNLHHWTLIRWLDVKVGYFST
jgi:hypothetical protein